MSAPSQGWIDALVDDRNDLTHEVARLEAELRELQEQNTRLIQTGIHRLGMMQLRAERAEAENRELREALKQARRHDPTHGKSWSLARGWGK